MSEILLVDSRREPPAAILELMASGSSGASVWGPKIDSKIDTVTDRVREIATVEVLHRFRSLADGDIDEKSPGDLVTVADRECERVLGAALREIRDAPVVGEEAAATHPDLVAAINASPAVWIVDPVDGTKNFVEGSEDFAVMVAFAEAGVTTTAWIWIPTTDRMVVASRGAGAWSDGAPIVRPAATTSGGILKSKYMPEPQKTATNAIGARLARANDRGCAGVEYLAMVDGQIGFLAYWRTKPWDHAPGSLIAQEVGLRSGRFDGEPYRPGDSRPGLLIADHESWPQLAADLDKASRA